MTEREKLEETLEALKTQDFYKENSDNFYYSSGRKAVMTRRMLAVQAQIKELDNE